MPVGSRNRGLRCAGTDMTLLVFIANNAFPPGNFTIWMERRHQGHKSVLSHRHGEPIKLESDWNTVTPERAVLIRRLRFLKHHAFLPVK